MAEGRSFGCGLKAVAPALLGACLAIAEPVVAGGSAAPADLAGSSWRLVTIQGADEAGGTIRPEDPSAYTLAFGRDGQVSVRLDCNRGGGAWRGDAADATGGSLAIGPLRVTRAMCPPPSLGDRLAQALASVRAYALREGRLHLSGSADDGTLVWEPADG